MDSSEERIGLNGAAAVLDVPAETVRHFVEEGRLRAERGEDGAYIFSLGEVVGLARGLGVEAAEEEIFEGEVMGEESSGNSRLPGRAPPGPPGSGARKKNPASKSGRAR